MNSDKVKVSIIIPCRNEVNHIGFVLESIENNTFKNYEVIVVDGLSDDGTREKLNEIVKNNYRIKIIENTRQITPVAFNLGIKNSVGEYIFIVGARHILEPNYIETCIKILDENPEVGCVGGKVNNKYENQTSALISRALSSSFAVGVGNFRIKNEDCYVDTVGTPVYRKSIFNEIGYFDEELIRNQDDEFNYRVIKKGYKILFTVKTSMQYFVRASYKNLFKQYYQYGFWKVFVNKKHKTITTIRQLIPFFFVLFLIFGILVSFLNKYCLFTYLSILLLYFLVNIYSSVNKSESFSDVFKLSFTFLLLHISYGFGYLYGVLRFSFIKAKPENASLTR